MADELIAQKRPCCKILRELTESLSVLASPEEASKVFDTISQHCVLIKFAGKSKTKVDFSTGNCFISVNPDEAEGVLTEVQKTAEAFGELAHHEELANKINQILANNADLKTIREKTLALLKEIREKGENRFGAVPFTDINRDQHPTHGLSAGELLKAHPALENATQFQGVNPKNNANPLVNPEAAKNAEQLQHQLQHQPGMSNAPKPRPT